MESFKIINSSLGLDNESALNDQDMIDAIEERVEKMLSSEPELLMSYLYRLDILEEKINAVMNQPKGMPIPKGLAHLIWQRQKQRVETKKRFKQKPIEGWEF